MIYLNIWYNNIIRFDLVYKINILNSHSFPYISKIIISSNLNFVNSNYLDVLRLITIIMLITGQKPVINKIYKSLNFIKNQKNSSINIRKTLRKKLAFELLNILVLLVIPNLIKPSKIYNFDKTHSLSIFLRNLTFFPQFKDQYDNFFAVIIFNIDFDLLGFNIFRLLLSSFQIIYY